MIQMMWDRGEPDGYANHMTSDPLPDTPAHNVLIDMAYGDHQVANVATEVEARTIGAPLRDPALDPGRTPERYVNFFPDLPTLGASPGRRPTATACSSGTSARSATDGAGGVLGTDPRADHQHRAGRLLRRRPARHGDQHLAADPPPDRGVPQSAGQDHRPLRRAPCYAAGWTGPP